LLIAIFAPLAGVLVDRLGRKPVLLISVILYGLAGGSGLVLNNLYAILAGRALLGVAVAGLMVSVTALIADYYSGQERSRVLGFQAAFMGFGGVVFLSLGGFLADLDWRRPFAIYLAALALAPLVALKLREPSRRAADEASEKVSEGDESGRQVLGVARLLVITYTLAIFGMVVFYVVPTQIPFYFESLLGIGPTGVGLAIALFSLSGSFTSLSYSRIRARLGYRTVAIVTFGLFGVGFALIGFAGSLPLALVGLVVGGAGAGLLPPNLFNWISSGAPLAIRGRVLGGLTAALFLGQFLSPVVIQPVVGTYGLGFAFVAAAVISVVLAIIVAATGRTKNFKVASEDRR
jgi:MFS family permease